jgi:hypothetical protein
MLEGWRFPADIREAIQFQLRPPSGADPPLLIGLHLARQLLGDGGDNAIRLDPVLENQLQIRGGTTEHLLELQRTCAEELEHLRRALALATPD